MNIEETDLPAAIRRAGDRIVARAGLRQRPRRARARDHLDWPAILAALDDVGYDGPLCIESFTADNATIATAASIWRPLARTQDAIWPSTASPSSPRSTPDADPSEARVTRPITLFTGQWADLPFTEVARLAGEWGYDGLEIACWGDHLDVRRAASDDDYVAERREILERNGLGVLGDLQPPQRPGGVRRPDRPAPPRHRAGAGLGRRRPRGRAAARRRGDVLDRPRRATPRRRHRRRLHRIDASGSTWRCSRRFRPR